jgi:ribosomal protein S27AE
MVEKQKNNLKTPVKIGLPTLVVYADRLHIRSLLLKNTEGGFPAVVVEYVEFTNVFGKKCRSKSFYIPPAGPTHSIICDIATGEEPFLKKSQVEISLLTATGIKYSVLFACESHSNPQCTFVSSKTTQMTPAEQSFSSKIFQEWVNGQGDNGLDGGPAGQNPPSEDTVLEQLRKAVFTEMYYLKNNGGRQYKISSGQFICKMSGAYAYQFEMESEVYLADDSPVKVSCMAKTAEGTVLLCDGFEILALLDSDLGNSIGSGSISVEPWKLLESLNKKIETISDLGPIGRKFLHAGPALANKLPFTHIPKGQEIAKEHALNSPITVIWGPPGTGKTHTMSEIAISLLKKGKSVLLVSHSNVSVDGVAAKIASLLREQKMEQYLKEGKVLRYGYIRDEQLSQDPYTSAYNYAMGKSQTLSQQMERLSKQKEKAKASYGNYSAEVLKLEQEIKAVRKRIRLEERKYVGCAQILATTVSKIHADSLFEDKKYDVVMFDEVSMAYVAQILCAASFAKERFICVGDFRQLSPIAQSNAKDTLSKDVFSFLGISDGMGHIYAHPWLVMLDEQRRMHSDIAAFANTSVYAKLLKNHASVYTSRESIVKREPFSGHATNLIDLTGMYCAAGKNSDNSRFNVVSAVLAFGSALAAEANGEQSVGIITPYAAQTRLVRAMIQDYRKQAKTETTCATVHQFQGSERNVVIFDAVESYPSTKTGWLMSKNENGSVTRLINVAVTRARGKLITVANRGYWFNKFGESDHALFKLIQHLLQRGNVVGVKEKTLQKYIEGTQFGKDIQVFTAREEAYNLFTRDVERSRKTILASIPGTAKFGEVEGHILERFKKAKETGVQLMIKAKKIEDLPQEWKEYTWGCDNAFLPTVLVDDKVLWYGFPQATGTFMDGNHGFATVFPVWIRFSGEHTIELIKSLAALDMRSQNNTEIPMTEKKAGKLSGIAAYVAKHETCPQCGQAMMLSKTKSGKTNLTCSHCGNTEFLTAASVNHYIKTNGVVCPKCRQHIYCGLSYKGLYIKCPENHWPKIEEL